MLEKPILKGKRVLLRPIVLTDAETFYAGFNDELVNYYTGTYQIFTWEQVRNYYVSIAQANNRVDYAILNQNQPEKIVGEVVLNEINWHNRSANFRIALLNQVYFGKGYGSEATRLILQYGFETLHLHRIELEVYDFNPRAIHVYEKAGFVREGVRREVLQWNGEYHSAIIMSLLKSEYERQKAQ